MPIEIRELQIKATISNDETSAGNNTGNDNSVDKEAIIAECVEQVVEILKSKSER